MKLILTTFAAAGFVVGCSGTTTDTASTTEQKATYASAITQGSTDPLTGTPGEEAAPSDADEDGTDGGLHRDCSLDGVRSRLIERYDADGDGVLNAEEQAALEADFNGQSGSCGHGGHGHGRGGHHGRMGEGMTETGTASATVPEGCGRRGHGPLHFRRLLWVYDLDGSGALDDAERAALEADLEARGANLEAKMLAEFDADADGALSDAELEAARAAHQAEKEAKRAAALAEFDADGDGHLSREERRAMHDAKKAALEAQFDADGNGTLDDTETAALREHLRAVVRGEIEE